MTVLQNFDLRITDIWNQQRTYVVDIINAISAGDIVFIMSSSESALFPRPLSM